jgi:hypothetical protein
MPVSMQQDKAKTKGAKKSSVSGDKLPIIVFVACVAASIVDATSNVDC